MPLPAPLAIRLVVYLSVSPLSGSFSSLFARHSGSFNFPSFFFHYFEEDDVPPGQPLFPPCPSKSPPFPPDCFLPTLVSVKSIRPLCGLSSFSSPIAHYFFMLFSAAGSPQLSLYFVPMVRCHPPSDNPPRVFMIVFQVIGSSFSVHACPCRSHPCRLVPANIHRPHQVHFSTPLLP